MLTVKFCLIRHLFSLPWKKSLQIDVIANAASTLIRYLLVPLIGMVWEIILLMVLEPTPANDVYFHVLPWVMAFVLACLINTLVESLIINVLFRQPHPAKTLRCLAMANLFCLSIAMGSLWWQSIT